MAEFVPDPGTLFYADRTSFRVAQGERNGTTVLERIRDASDDDRVFRCVAVDVRAIIADIEYGSCYGEKRRMLLRRDVKAIPVGPEVIAALGLEA